MSNSKLETAEFLTNIKSSVDKGLESGDEVLLKLDAEAVAFVTQYLHKEGYHTRTRVEIDLSSPLPQSQFKYPFKYSIEVRRF